MSREPYESLVAIDRGVRELLSPEEIRKLDRPLLPDSRSRSDDELVAELAALGVAVDRETFRRDASSQPSAEELAAHYAERLRLRLKNWDFERTWIALALLWERWLPERPSLEMLDECIAEGYARWKKDDTVGCAEKWLAAWPVFLRIVDETDTRSLGEFDEVFRLSELAFNWVQDVALNLWNAGLKEERFHRAGIGFFTEYLVRFDADDQLITENMRRALASFHMRLGETEKVDALYEKWLGHDPQWGWGWIGWSDGYRFDARPPQLERTEALLDRALAVPDLRDELDVLERLQDLYGDQGREDEARSLQARIESLPRARRFRGELPEPFDDGVHEHVETIARVPRSAGMSPVRAEAGRSTRNAAGDESSRRRGTRKLRGALIPTETSGLRARKLDVDALLDLLMLI